MNCTACGSGLYWRNEENTKNHTCWNFDCPSRKEAKYCCNVSVRPGWHFLERYHLPIKIEDRWYSIVGPEYDNTSVLTRLNPRQWVAVDANERVLGHFEYEYNGRVNCFIFLDGSIGAIPPNMFRWKREDPLIIRVPYMALPHYEPDFTEQFAILKDKLLSVEKPIAACIECGESHDPDDECEEEALMKKIEVPPFPAFDGRLRLSLADKYPDYKADCHCTYCTNARAIG